MKLRIFLLCYFFAIVFATQNTIYYSLDDFDLSALGLESIQGLFNKKPLNDPVAQKVTTNVSNCYEIVKSETVKPWHEYRVARHKVANSSFYAKRTNPIAKFLNISVIYENENTFELIIKDHNRSSFEIPLKEPFPHKSLLNFDSQNFSKNVLNYHVDIQEDPFSVRITRKLTNEVIFDMKEENLLLSKQYLEFGSSIPTLDIFGMGERNFQFRLIPGIYTVWARDEVGDIETGQHPGHNSYGVHPMYLNKEKSGNYFISFLRSSNPFDFTITNQSTINYKIAGGIIHLKFFLGDIYPETAIKRYHEYIEGFGMPPFWAFGFHQSRWGYQNIAALRDSLEGHKRHDIPIEVIWLDVDYMYDHIPFTNDAKRFNPIKLKALKAEFDVKLVPIIDPAIPYKTSPVSKELLDQNCYVRDTSGNPFIGRLHSGESIFPDFFHPRAKIFWSKMFLKLHEEVPFDGIWLDMNEPTSFCDGACFKYPFGLPKTQYDLEAWTAAEDVRLLPYVPGNRSLEVKTLSLNSIHYPHRVHIDVHSLYSIQENYETFKILKEKFEMELPFILTRSSYAGNGKYAAHWTGDNLANWDFLKISVPSLLNLNMFGIPMSGDDICGFFGNTTEPLCARWIQLSSLYPFSRNHNHKEFTDHQFHNMGPNIISLARKAYKFRYSLLKYYYSLFLQKRGRGVVMQPLFFKYIDDPMLFEDTIMNTQFLLGNDVMITPILDRFKEHVTPYFPRDIWYDLHTGRKVMETSEKNRHLLIYNSMSDLVPIYARGGSIIPFQSTVNVSNTNDLTNDYLLHIFLQNNKAEGPLIDIDNLADEKMINKACIEDPNGCLFSIQAEVGDNEGDYFSVRVHFTKNQTNETISKTNSISKLVLNTIDLNQINIPILGHTAGLIIHNHNNLIVEKESGASFSVKSHPKDQGQLVFEFEPVLISHGSSFEVRIQFNEDKNWLHSYYLTLLVVLYVLYGVYRVIFH